MRLVCQGFPPRQEQVMIAVTEGKSGKEIAKELGCSPDNVKNTLSVIYYKLGAKNVASAVAEGFKRGHLKYIPIILICLSTILGSISDVRPVRRPARSVSVVRVINSRAA